jgi:hypothetical protein
MSRRCVLRKGNNHGLHPQKYSDRRSSRRRLGGGASVQVTAEGDTRARLIWIVDVLPNEIAPYVAGQMDQAALAMQRALGRDQ